MLTVPAMLANGGMMLWLILLVSAVVYITLDLNQPRRGFIQVSQAPMERLIASMK